MRSIAPLSLAVLLFLGFATAARAESTGWVWPVEGEVITPYRNGDDPYAGGQHRGVDIAAAAGTPVGAATAGIVTFAGTAGASGLTVTVRTADGRFDTSYLHLGSIDVREGENVEPGAPLGTVGTSGRRSSERPHLHLGVRSAGTRHAYHDPLLFLPPGAVARPADEPRPDALPQPAPPVAVPGIPVPVEPLSAPAPTPAGAPAPISQPARLPAPSALPARAGPGQTSAPAAAPASRGGPGPAAVPAGPERSGPAPDGPRERHAPRRADAPRPALTLPSRGPRAAADTAATPRAEAAPPRRPQPRPSHGGLDVGWLLACAALVLAAALAHGGKRHGQRPGGSSLGALGQRLGWRWTAPARE